MSVKEIEQLRRDVQKLREEVARIHRTPAVALRSYARIAFVETLEAIPGVTEDSYGNIETQIRDCALLEIVRISATTGEVQRVENSDQTRVAKVAVTNPWAEEIKIAKRLLVGETESALWVPITENCDVIA